MVKIDWVVLMEKKMLNFSRFDRFIIYNYDENKEGYVGENAGFFV
jgi:hypothetical protein